MEFDVFLSHNSKDKPAVRELARRLADRNIRVWLDEDQLIPGRNWQPLLEQGIAQSSTGAVVVGKDGLGPWEDEEMQALLRQAASSGNPVIPVLLPRAPKKPKLPLFLSNRIWVDLRKGFTDQGLDKLVWGITGTPAGATPAAPESRVSRRRWALAFVALVAAAGAGLLWWGPWRAPTQPLAGTVLDATGEPLAGVQISLPEHGLTTSTDALGRFHFQVRAAAGAMVTYVAQYPELATHEDYAAAGTMGLKFMLERKDP